MYNHAAGTLAFRAKYSLSSPNDQPLCCHLPCYYLLARHCFLSGYLYSPFPSKTLFLVGRRKLRSFCDSRDSDIMRLLVDQEEILPDEVGSIWKKGRREVEIESIEGECRGSSMEGKARRSSSRKNNLSDSVRNSKLDEIGRKRPGRETLVGYGNSKKATRYDRVDVVVEEVWEVNKYADDIWQKSRYCSNSNKKDLALDARNKEPTGRNRTLIRLGVMDAEEKVDQRTSLAKRVNINESGSDGSLKRATRMCEVQLDDVKQPSVSACARKVAQRESLAYAAGRNCDMDLRVNGNEEHRKSVDQQSKAGHSSYNGVRNDAHPRRDFEETSFTGRGDRSYLKQNSARKSQGKIVYLDKQAVEQVESRKGTQKIGEVSLFHGGGFEKASHFDDERVMRRDRSINLIQDLSPVSKSKRSLMELQLSIENKSEEREGKLPMTGSSVQLTEDMKKLIDRRAIEHDKVIRNTHMLSGVSEVHCGNTETFSLSGDKIGIELRPNFAQNPMPSTKDKGTQVEMHEAYDHIEMSKLNAKNSSTSSRISLESQVDPLEYSTLLSMKHVSSMREQNNQGNRQDNLLHTASMKSQGDTTELNLTNSSNKRSSNFQGTYSSRIENEEEFASTKISSVALTPAEEISKTSITGEKSLSASIEATSSGILHNISRSQRTYSGLNNDVNKIQLDINDSANKFDKSLVSHVGKFVGDPQEMIVPTSIKETALYSGIQIGKPDRRDVQTLSLENNKETLEKSSLTQESKERHSSLFIEESSQWNTEDVTSTGNLGDFSCSVKAHNEADSHNGRVDIHHFTSDATEHAQQLAKSSVLQVDEFVDNVQLEIMSLNESGNEPTVYSEFQFEELGLREETTDMQVGELTGNRRDRDVKHMKVGGRQSSSGLGVRGPSDEIWHVQGIFSQETSSAEEHKDDSLTSCTMNATIPTHLETTVTRRSPKSLWSYVADIIRMSWILRGHSHGSTLKSDKRSSSNDSLSSEVWFSGPESDADKVGDEFEYANKIGLLKDSEPVKEPVKLFLEESKNEERLTMMEPSLSITSSVGEEQMQDLKSSQGTLSSISVVEQQLGSASDTALISISDIVEPRMRDKLKVLKPSSSYPIAARRSGFSSSITQARSVDNMEAALVEGNNSSLENFEQPSVSAADSALLRITDIEEVDNPERIPKLELDAFGGNYESGIKQRKFQRNTQLPSEQFDKWEKAFKRENEQKRVDEFFMREAILEAKKGADTWEVPVGAVLVHNGKIIARSCNMVEELRDSTAHAEMICIREASNLLRTWRLTETTLYVTLEPCPMCAGAILQARIDTVVWGAPNRLLGADGSWVRLFPGEDEGSSSSLNPPGQIVGPVHPFHPKIKIRRGVLETECGDVMHQFFKLRRKKDKKLESSPPSCLPISNRPTKFFSRMHRAFLGRRIRCIRGNQTTVNQKHQLLNSDEHANFLKKQNKDPSEYRPDIIHQALLAILDSPLTKAGRLQALYIRSTRHALIDIKPHVRIPRTFKRFCGLMVQLLEKQKITAVGSREKLLALIKNPVTDHLPVNSQKIGLSYSSDKLVQMHDYVAAASDSANLVFVVGVMSHGVIDKGFIDDFISVSNYRLSAACCLNRICNVLEQKWKIL